MNMKNFIRAMAAVALMLAVSFGAQAQLKRIKVTIYSDYSGNGSSEHAKVRIDYDKDKTACIWEKTFGPNEKTKNYTITADSYSYKRPQYSQDEAYELGYRNKIPEVIAWSWRNSLGTKIKLGIRSRSTSANWRQMFESTFDMTNYMTYFKDSNTGLDGYEGNIEVRITGSTPNVKTEVKAYNYKTKKTEILKER
jgi:hypothetical protein